MQELPPESRTKRRNLTEGDYLRATWDQKHELLATVIDVLTAANWQRGDGKGRQPDPYPRPR